MYRYEFKNIYSVALKNETDTDEIQTAFKNDNKDVLEKAFNKEMKIKKPNISKEVYEVGDLVRIIKPSDKTRQVWSNEVYEIERVYKPKKSYSVYEYKLNEFKDRFKEEELLKIVGNPQNKLLKVAKFVISKLLRPVIKDNKEHYEVQWKGYREKTLEPRDILLKDVPKMVSQFEKNKKLNFMIARTRKLVR